MFSRCTGPPDSKETKLISSHQVRNTGVVLVPCHIWKCVPTATVSGEDISEVLVCHVLWQMSFQ